MKLSIGILQNISGKHTPEICWLEKEQGIIRSDGILVCGKLPSSNHTHRIAISNYRIKSMTDSSVTFTVKDYNNKGISGIL